MRRSYFSVQSSFINIYFRVGLVRCFLCRLSCGLCHAGNVYYRTWDKQSLLSWCTEFHLVLLHLYCNYNTNRLLFCLEVEVVFSCCQICDPTHRHTFVCRWDVVYFPCSFCASITVGFGSDSTCSCASINALCSLLSLKNIFSTMAHIPLKGKNTIARVAIRAMPTT